VAAVAFAGYVATRSDSLSRAEALYARAGDPDSLAHVVRLSHDHLNRQPWSRRAALLAARALSRLDRPQIAEQYYRRAGTLDRADAHLRAYAILRSNEREQAIAAYREILARWPDDAEALRLLGGIYFSRKQYDEALDVARRLRSVSTTAAAEGHRLAAAVFHDTGNPEEAAAEYERVLAVDPRLERLSGEGRTAFWHNLATDLLAIGRARETIVYLRRALSEQENSLLRTLLGRAYQQLGELDAAESCWRRAVADDPKAGVAWLELGRLELARNRLESAASALERAQAQAPDDSQVLYSLRTVYRRQGRIAEADRIDARLERLRSLAPSQSGGMGARAQ
jgi:tetratricopeptide (TPR) repeat protein